MLWLSIWLIHFFITLFKEIERIQNPRDRVVVKLKILDYFIAKPKDKPEVVPVENTLRKELEMRFNIIAEK